MSLPARDAPRQCVVLVGGLGTRLGALTKAVPKPLLPVGGAPFLDLLLDEVARFGFSNVLLLAGHEGAQVVEYAASFGARRPSCRLSIEVLVEAEPLGTGGALRAALPRLDEQFLLINGDSWFDFNWLDLNSLAAGFPAALMAMAVRYLDDASRSGTVTLAGNRVVGFGERGHAAAGHINGGVYLVARSLIETIEAKASLERDVIPAAVRAGQVIGRVYDRPFLDIGVPASYAQAQTELPRWRRRPAVFFDRDGTLNLDTGYVHLPEQFVWIEGAIALVKAANDAGLYVFIVTNQAGVAHGYYEEESIVALHDFMQQALRRVGAHIDDFRHCPFHPEGKVDRYRRASDWRKPGPGMILDLLEHWDVDLARSVLIGDRPSDIEAAAAAGLRGILFDGGRLGDLKDEILSEAG